MSDAVAIRESERIVELDLPGSARLELRIPEVFGMIRGAELRGEYAVVFTEGGRVSFHAQEPERVSNVSWRREHPLLGKMHWHSIRKALRENCLLPELGNRVSFDITHHAYKSGGRSDAGASARVLIDKKVVFACGEDFLPWELGAALAEYLYPSPEAAVLSTNPVVAAVGLVDRRLSERAFRQIEARAQPLWQALHDLRMSLLRAHLSE